MNDKDKNFNTPDINSYHMNNTAVISINESDNFLFKPFDKKENKNQISKSFFIDTFDNQNTQLKSNNTCSFFVLSTNT